ncbi:MAG: hypothetical protein IJS93_03375 [Clostridia bacterium]|nr:hypothetical protein [Clostridia bacterium]
MNERITDLWKDYRKGKDYAASIGLNERIKTNVAFFEGKQWAPSTEATRTMPRPIVNIVKFICRNKRAMLTSTPVKLVYSSKTDKGKAQILTDFAAYVLKEMDVEELDSRAIRDGILKGSYFYHLYWNSDKGNDGELACELIDPEDIFFHNPLDSDEQKQKWIIVSSRVEVDALKKVAEGDVDLIEGDADEDGICTVLTRYYRVNGEVWCEKATKRTIVKKPFRITPEGVKRKAELYPIVAGVYEEKEKCIYGLSEAEELINNQKLINHVLGMEALAIQNVAWGKYIVTKDALRGQSISNEPGEVLVDYSMTGNGIRKLEQHVLSSTPMNFVNNVTAMTRTVAGATEVMTGETLIGNMSGAAIAQLQSQANQPIMEQRKRFWRVKKKFGLVLAQCFKLYYDEKKWYEDDVEREFRSDDFDGEYEVTVEAVAGANGTTSGDIQLLETLYKKGDIDARTFVAAYPVDSLCEKDKLIKIIFSNSPSEQSEPIESTAPTE